MESKLKPQKAGLKIILVILALLFLFLSKIEAKEYTNSQIANAIYKAENSVKYPYGIRSIDTKGNKEYARKICLNTIRNHRKRHTKHKCGLDFITCFGNRYCPPQIHLLNKNWIKNVKFWLRKGGGR